MHLSHLRPTQLHWQGLKDIPFTIILRNKFERGAPESLKNSDITLLFRTEETTATEFGNLNAEGFGHWVPR